MLGSRLQSLDATISPNQSSISRVVGKEHHGSRKRMYNYWAVGNGPLVMEIKLNYMGIGGALIASRSTTNQYGSSLRPNRMTELIIAEKLGGRICYFFEDVTVRGSLRHILSPTSDTLCS